MKKFILGLSILFVFTLGGCTTKKDEEEYLQNLESLAKQSYELAAKSEEIGVGFSDTWRKVIFDKKVKIGGQDYSDFNEAIPALQIRYVEMGKMETIDTLQTEAKATYKAIKDKDIEKYDEEYKAVKAFYLETVEFKDLCVNPTGSYNDFSENLRSKRDSVMSSYSSLKVELDLDE